MEFIAERKWKRKSFVTAGETQLASKGELSFPCNLLQNRSLVTPLYTPLVSCHSLSLVAQEMLKHEEVVSTDKLRNPMDDLSLVFLSAINFLMSFLFCITNEISFTIISLSSSDKFFLKSWFSSWNYYYITNYDRNLLRITLYIRY